MATMGKGLIAIISIGSIFPSVFCVVNDYPKDLEFGRQQIGKAITSCFEKRFIHVGRGKTTSILVNVQRCRCPVARAIALANEGSSKKFAREGPSNCIC